MNTLKLSLANSNTNISTGLRGVFSAAILTLLLSCGSPEKKLDSTPKLLESKNGFSLYQVTLSNAWYGKAYLIVIPKNNSNKTENNNFPKLIQDTPGFKLYKWAEHDKPYGSIYFMVCDDGTTSMQFQDVKTPVKSIVIHQEEYLSTLLALWKSYKDEDLQKLGLPSSNDKFYNELVSLNHDQLQNLGLLDKYNDFLNKLLKLDFSKLASK